LALIQKIMQGKATEAESERFQALHVQKTSEVLETPIDQLFVISETAAAIPPRASVEPSAICAKCGEPTMPAKMVTIGTDSICRECAASVHA
jgi:formylmethanofuran dehydrogenase subunit E